MLKDREHKPITPQYKDSKAAGHQSYTVINDKILAQIANAMQLFKLNNKKMLILENL